MPNKKIEMDDKYIRFANCYTYALNMDIPTDTNIGDISWQYNSNYNYKDFERLFIDDCNTLDISVKKVEPDCNLLNENEWLVVLYGTDYYIKNKCKTSDFHLIKKNYSEKWSGKYLHEMPHYKDDNNDTLDNVKDALFAILDDEENVVLYNYIGTYKLIKKW